MHVNDQVAWEKFPRRLALFPFLDFRDALGWNQHVIIKSPISSVLTRFKIFSRTLFSCPESTCTTYHWSLPASVCAINQCNRVKKWTKFTRTKSKRAT